MLLGQSHGARSCAALRVRRSSARSASPALAQDRKVRHASFGAAGRRSPTSAPSRATRPSRSWPWPTSTCRATEPVKKLFPDVRVYQDWRELLDKEEDNSTRSTSRRPTTCTRRSPWRRCRCGKHVYMQKPLTQTIHETRVLAAVRAAGQAWSRRWASRSRRTRRSSPPS